VTWLYDIQMQHSSPRHSLKLAVTHTISSELGNFKLVQNISVSMQLHYTVVSAHSQHATIHTFVNLQFTNFRIILVSQGGRKRSRLMSLPYLTPCCQHVRRPSYSRE